MVKSFSDKSATAQCTYVVGEYGEDHEVITGTLDGTIHEATSYGWESMITTPDETTHVEKARDKLWFYLRENAEELIEKYVS